MFLWGKEGLLELTGQEKPHITQWYAVHIILTFVGFKTIPFRRIQLE